MRRAGLHLCQLHAISQKKRKIVLNKLELSWAKLSLGLAWLPTSSLKVVVNYLKRISFFLGSKLLFLREVRSGGWVPGEHGNKAKLIPALLELD